MGRLFFWVVLIAVLALAWIVSRRRNRLSNEERLELELYRQQAKEKAAERVVKPGESMTKCEHCGLYFPTREAVHNGSHVYCGAQCRRDAQK